MHKTQQKSKEVKLGLLPEDKRSLVIGTVVGTLIAITPYLFYLYESVPDIQIWDTFLFTFNSNFYQSAKTAIWILTGKLIPVYLLFIWFFTCRHWWYHVLLVPIAMYIFQIMNILNDDISYVDELQMIYLIPVMAIVIPSIYLIRARIFNKINDANKSLEELEEEFKISPKNFWGKVKEYF
ncbi:MAG: hypothetical protein P8K68_11455 [Algibacter sp.]|uniref:hypothetical protein n=1 Tax=Algibacter sp. TaxID=1872428 RepID=UPI00261A37F4|nr:hypothetical protein [Algibacter sp.]MDG1730881.1 hypothetical protein [Algibacter sp.]MDG2179383.1 hypothetical protein [Algibacter sp.]